MSKTPDVHPEQELIIIMFLRAEREVQSFSLQRVVNCILGSSVTFLIFHADRYQRGPNFDGLDLNRQISICMRKFRTSQKLLLALYVIGIFLFCHHFIFRPVILDWGAPESIRDLKLSGDVFTRGDQHTRAVLINATPEKLWPWLVQIGQERGGFYSHQWLENLFFAEMKNVYSLDSRFQQPRHVGDTVWLADKKHYAGGGYQIIAEFTPLRSYVMVGGSDYARIQEGQQASGSWAFYLYPQSDSSTWLVVRSSSGEISAGEKLLRYFAFEVPHFIMEARMINTIKRLVEEKS